MPEPAVTIEDKILVVTFHDGEGAEHVCKYPLADGQYKQDGSCRVVTAGDLQIRVESYMITMRTSAILLMGPKAILHEAAEIMLGMPLPAIDALCPAHKTPMGRIDIGWSCQSCIEESNRVPA